LRSDFSFEDANAKINTFHAVTQEITELENQKEFELINLDYNDAKFGLIGAARAHAEKIVLRLVARHR
jgi:hypothetical protein